MSFYIRKNGVTKKVSGLGSYSEGDGIDISGNNISVDTTFTEASTRTNISSGDTFATILGKIKKWFSDLPSMFVSKSGDTMTGDLTIEGQMSNYLTLGSDNAPDYGILQIYGGNGYKANIQESVLTPLTADRDINLPNKSGTIALTSDLDNKLDKDLGWTYSTDLNTLKSDGLYHLGTGQTNVPSGIDADWSTLYVNGNGVETASQTFISRNNIVYTRVCISGTWSSWNELALKSDIFAEFKGGMGDNNNPSLDFNNYTTNGWYDNTGTNRAGTANAPHNSDNGYLLVVSRSRTVYQFWFSCYQGNGVVFRKQHVGTWSAWTVVIS